MDQEELLTRKTAAKILGVSTVTLAQWAWKAGTDTEHELYIPIVRINSRNIRYRKSDLNKFLLKWNPDDADKNLKS